MTDAVGAYGDIRIAARQREQKRLVDRLAPEDDLQHARLSGNGRRDGKIDRGTLEFPLAQHVVLRDRLPRIIFPHHKAVAVGLRLERDRPVAHDGLVARQLHQQGDALRLVLQSLPVAGHGVECDHAQGNAGDHHDDQQFEQRETARPYGSRQAQTVNPSRYGIKAVICDYWSHEPISASAPVPPGWASAPSEKTSTSPFTPGDRY